MDAFIDTVVASADAVGARLRKGKRIDVSFDEWNVWRLSRFEDGGMLTDWSLAPRLIEETSNAAAAVVVGRPLISLLRHSDRVAAACLAQLVNVQASPLARGQVLRAALAAPTYETARYGHVPVVETAASHDPDTDDLVVLAVNRHQSAAVQVAIDLGSWPQTRMVSASVLADQDPRAANTLDATNRVRPQETDTAHVDEATVYASRPLVSWDTVRLRLAGHRESG